MEKNQFSSIFPPQRVHVFFMFKYVCKEFIESQLKTSRYTRLSQWIQSRLMPGEKSLSRLEERISEILCKYLPFNGSIFNRTKKMKIQKKIYQLLRVFLTMNCVSHWWLKYQRQRMSFSDFLRNLFNHEKEKWEQFPRYRFHLGFIV